MLRNIFFCFTVIGCALLIPITTIGGQHPYDSYADVATLLKLTPQYIFGTTFWAWVVIAYLFEAIVCGFIYHNYRAVLGLRRAYFRTSEYRNSLHSRTLLVRHLPQATRTDEGVARIASSIKDTGEIPRASVARNVKELPTLIDQHDKTIIRLEAVLARYLRNPDRLPPSRPMIKPYKDDQHAYPAKVDAIDYLSIRARRLEVQIKHVRESLEKRNSMPYGFASYSHIEDAHATAYAAQQAGGDAKSITLAPKPTDLLWRNLAMTKSTRRTRMFWDGLWMVLLTVAYIPLNILSSVFLSNFSHIGILWSGFQTNLYAHPVAWGIAQGITAPLFQFLIFLALPTLFRRLYNHSGDISKTSRERHVASRLYAFFVFNSLFVFSVFGSAFQFVAAVVRAQDASVWDAIKHQHPFTNFMAGLCNVSTFWLTYQLQQNLSAAIDIAQLWPLIVRWFRRKFSDPTPRQMIALSAPQPFDYASYYNTYMFIGTVGMVFGVLQPLIFPITAFYLVIELYFKRYMLQYICFTKNESGGVFWRTIVNRMLFAILLANAVVALIVGSQGVGAQAFISDAAANAGMLYAMIPLPFLLFGFKWYLSHTFDNKMRYVSIASIHDLEKSTDVERPGGRKDRVAVKFGHPALYKKLLAPMVHAKSEHMLKEILKHEAHSSASRQGFLHTDSFGYSDVYNGDATQAPERIPVGPNSVPFEFVQEGDLDFQNFKRRAEFRDQFGGDGELYGRPGDSMTASRPGTPSTMANTFMGIDEVPYKGSPRPTSTDSRRPSQTILAQHTPRKSSAADIDAPLLSGRNTPDPYPRPSRDGRATPDLNPHTRSPITTSLVAGTSSPEHSPYRTHRPTQSGTYTAVRSESPHDTGRNESSRLSAIDVPTPSLERDDIFRAGERAVRRKPI
ncbi:hypothetical protein EJ05DRAFT_472038 [Pseudovirgaria hyperparasitica]|uniref:DUF221-domain-containing protein n=1 Tax=Pseudovirgaria hyperparasitica TaxID=470096 RepID=A0A6A6WLN6_9PEZI|nr:uncharacterized protein EJ05DRAFT_472038 [Pseudovirgaria hyperparasitica]KAF2763101.1 hypothetical protein EJ05DRAFT_472038 [Pseudovirgaria hyperparasitica]